MRTILSIFLVLSLLTQHSYAQEKPTAILGTTTIIKAVLSQKLVSDYPGPFRGYVTHDVYDTKREYVLIPKGSIIHGQVIRISNVNEPISARVGYIIKSITRPDDTVIDMTSDAAVDNEGVSGIKDKVNKHLFAQFMGVIAYALIGTEASGTQTGGLDGNFEYDEEVKRNTLDQFQPLAAKYLKLVPTITIRSGQTFNIFIEKPKKITPFRSIFHEFLS